MPKLSKKAHNDIHKDSDSLELGAKSLTRRSRLGIEHYQRKYPGNKFAWIPDDDAMLNQYLEAGFEPVKKHNPCQGKAFEDLTGKKGNEWECLTTGTTAGGGTQTSYLLMIDAEIYQKIAIDPKHEHNREIQNSMRSRRQAGGVTSEDRGNDSPAIHTYAPELPTGGRGYEQLQDLPNKVFNSLK